MRRVKSIITVMCLMAITTAWAGPVSETRARSIAAGFMASHAIPSINLRMAQKAPSLNGSATSGNAAYYVFNGNRGGYVIVAGDDRAPAVLGYSDKGTFDPQDVPEAMQELLEGYAAQIDAIDGGAKAPRHLANGHSIAPLVTAQWSQRTPYNTLLPYVVDRHVPVGCVATAMAQVMYYWKWPERPTAVIPDYTTESLDIYMPQLPIENFEWGMMRDTYETDDTLSAKALAAAKLSLYCAQSVEMDFTKNGSGASSSDIPYALINYFGYKPDARYVRRMFYTTTQWEQLIYDELAAKRPVIYRGSKEEGGHAYICDGYDGNGMFHINWGWNGQSNGYFLLSMLDPENQGTGSASGSYGYIYNQAIVIGIQPGTVMSAPLEVTVKQIDIQSSNNSRVGLNANFSVTQQTQFLNHNSDVITFDYGWGLYQGDTMVKLLDSGTKDYLDSYYFTRITRTLEFGAGISGGSYRIVPLYSEVGANNWRPCIGADVNYIEVTITSTMCTFTIHGANLTPDYEINNINVSGHMHPNRPVNIKINVTNKGNTRNDLIYMFANGELYSSAFIDLEKGESGDAEFSFVSETTGTFPVYFCLKDDFSAIIGSQNITINTMPVATLTGSTKVYNEAIDNTYNRIINDNKFRLRLTLTNDSQTTAYDEDITVKLYKHTHGNYGTLVQQVTEPVYLDPLNTTMLQFDLDNVMDGWSYFVQIYYYSNGQEKYLTGASTHTMVFPNTPSYPRGDVNGDSEVNIADVNCIIDAILGNFVNSHVLGRCDVNGDGEINIADVNAVIDIILRS